MPGYPAEDLYLKRHFVEANQRAVEELARGRGHRRPGRLRRAGAPAAATAAAPTTPSPSSRGGEVRGRLPQEPPPQLRRLRRAALLRSRAASRRAIEVAGTRVGLTICEDFWVEGPPASTEAAEGAELIANPSGSPYHRGKGREREEMFAERARAYGAHFAFCNLVGGQDELVFDGQSFVVDPAAR